MAGSMTRGLSSFIWRSSCLASTSRPLVIRPLRPSVVISARRSLGDESGISGRQESFNKQGSYEGHGKTSVSILNEDCEGINMIDSFAQDGFRLSDDTKILGPCVIFPTAVLGNFKERWFARKEIDDLRLDLLVIGHGGRAEVRDPVRPEVILKMKKKGLNIEVLTTEKAISTYNFLVEEGRVVAAALIPPETVNIMDIDVVETKERYRKLLSHPDHDWMDLNTMGIYHIFIVSKSGGLIFNYDHKVPETEHEKTYSYPLDIQLKFENKRVQVAFGERDGVCIGHALLAVNGEPLTYKELPDGRDVFEVLADKSNFPLNLKFGRPTITTNEKIVLASIFYPLFALAVQLSPEQGSSGIREIETDTFKLHCHQTLTGVKFVVVADRNQAGVDQLLDKIYELYADFALKNPFYSLEMPIRADLFDEQLQVAIDQIERTGFI